MRLCRCSRPARCAGSVAGQRQIRADGAAENL